MIYNIVKICKISWGIIMEVKLQVSDVFQAKKRIKDYVKVTPLIRAENLEKLFDGAEIWLKLENMQYTGAFKLRGVSNKMLITPKEELQKGVTAASSGNHAQAVI